MSLDTLNLSLVLLLLATKCRTTSSLTPGPQDTTYYYRPTAQTKKPTTSPITVMLPNGERIQSSHEAELLFKDLPGGAIRAHLFPQLQGQALLSIGVFCDAGCTANFTATSVQILHKGKIVLEGARSPPGLWTTTMSTTNIPAWQAKGAHTDSLKVNEIKYLHAACFRPTTETWVKAINQGFLKRISHAQLPRRTPPSTKV
jgi:hypothetical protein